MSEYECYDGERLCEVCQEKEAWYSCRDCPSQRDLCNDCFTDHDVKHGLGAHSYLTIMRLPRPGQEPWMCQRHGFQLDLTCVACKVPLCLECQHKDTCPSSKGGTDKHRTEMMKDSANVKRENIMQILKDVDARKVDGKAALCDLDRVGEKSEGEKKAIESALEGTFQSARLICGDYKQYLQEESNKHFNAVKKEIAESREKTREYLNKAEVFSKEAKNLLASSDVEVFLEADTIVERLPVTVEFTLPSFPAIFVKAPPKQERQRQLESAVGTLFISRPRNLEALDHVILQTRVPIMNVNGKGWSPSSQCLVESSTGCLMVEAFFEIGLYSLNSSQKRNKVSMGKSRHYGVCPGMDGKVVYSPTGKKGTVNIYSTIGERLVCISEVSIEEAKGLTSIRTGTVTGRLVVVDEIFPRLTIHSPDFSFSRAITAAFDGAVLRRPSDAEWSSCEEYMYVSDVSEEFVVKLLLANEPPLVLWKQSLLGEKPRLIRAIDQRVYVTHKVEHKVTVLSAMDGAVVRVIRTPGVVADVRKTWRDAVELVFYS